MDNRSGKGSNPRILGTANIFHSKVSFIRATVSLETLTTRKRRKKKKGNIASRLTAMPMLIPKMTEIVATNSVVSQPPNSVMAMQNPRANYRVGT